VRLGSVSMLDEVPMLSSDKEVNRGWVFWSSRCPCLLGLSSCVLCCAADLVDLASFECRRAQSLHWALFNALGACAQSCGTTLRFAEALP